MKTSKPSKQHTGGHKTRVRDIFDGLTLLEYRFCHEYLVDANGKLAYIRAGGSSNYQTAQRQSYLLLKRREIREKIRALVQDHLVDTDVRAKTVLHALAALAFTSIRDVARWDGQGRVTVIPSADLAPEHAFAVQNVKSVTRYIPQKNGEPIEETTIEVRLYDKKRPLELLGRHLQLFAADKHRGMAGDLGAKLERARQRNEQRLRVIASGKNKQEQEKGVDDNGG
jgi:hypothetical protein